MRKHVSGEKGRAREEEMHPHPPLALSSAERFERLVSTWHPGSRTKRLGPQGGKRKGESQTSEGLTGAAGGAGGGCHQQPLPRGSGASAVCRSDLSEPGWGAAAQGGPRSPLRARGEHGLDDPAAAAGASRSRDPRSPLQVRARRGVTLPARRGSSGEAMGAGWGRRAPEGPGRPPGPGRKAGC